MGTYSRIHPSYILGLLVLFSFLLYVGLQLHKDNDVEDVLRLRIIGGIGLMVVLVSEPIPGFIEQPLLWLAGFVLVGYLSGAKVSLQSVPEIEDWDDPL